ncbi:MAG TPA: proline--tRNA ligase [archaeon]|nr:proline--tRNA ligase [archaeon]
MAEEQTLGLTVKKEEDFSEWYNQVVIKAELADHGPIKGFMIIRPNAYAIWETIQEYFNKVIFSHGVRNAYFPLLIPESFFKKEAEHAQGFAPELAWVEKAEGEEKVAIRPTSETIMYDSYAKWIRSWRDLPLRINQWCNVLRWEVKQTKLFLRTREFLWQEGHCVYATKEQTDKEVRLILDEYKKMVEELLAIPVIAGKKTDAEKFAGALYTTTIEALMPDGKALQMGTSHNLGQGFAKSFGLKFLDENRKEQLPWQTSWGFSTRLIGAIIMVHGDDKGLVFPPRIAKNKAVIIPIIFDKSREVVMEKAEKLGKELKSLGVFVDTRDNYSVGWKYSDWELKGIPLRIEIGPKDIEKKQVVVVRRDSGKKEFVPEKDLKKRIPEILEEMQSDMFAKAKKFLDSNIVEAKNYAEFKKLIKDRKFVYAYFCEDAEEEKKIKDETGATSRCIPFDEKEKNAKCIFTGKPAKKRVLFAKAY